MGHGKWTELQMYTMRLWSGCCCDLARGTVGVVSYGGGVVLCLVAWLLAGAVDSTVDSGVRFVGMVVLWDS